MSCELYLRKGLVFRKSSVLPPSVFGGNGGARDGPAGSRAASRVWPPFREDGVEGGFPRGCVSPLPFCPSGRLLFSFRASVLPCGFARSSHTLPGLWGPGLLPPVPGPCLSSPQGCLEQGSGGRGVHTRPAAVGPRVSCWGGCGEQLSAPGPAGSPLPRS